MISFETSNFCWKAGTSISTADAPSVAATHVAVTDDTLTVELSDGRTISAPLAWYPRLLDGTADERQRAGALIGQGHEINWPELDEDVSVENYLPESRRVKVSGPLRSGEGAG